MAHIEVPHPGASEVVGRMLRDALAEHPDFQWLGLVSEDGFAIASEGEVDVDDDAVAAGAVRMMMQVRSMSKSLGQSGTSQMFVEGGESGICVIDKDPWVLILVGAPGVPIGLLRYEAREIAESFPMGQRPALTEVAEQVVETDGEPEIRWADEAFPEEPVVEEPVVEESVADSFFEPVSEVPEPVIEQESFDLVIDEPAPGADALDSFFEQPAGTDWSEPTPEPPAGFGDVFAEVSDAVVPEVPELDLSALAPPSGIPIDLPPPAGPAFQLPPPV